MLTGTLACRVSVCAWAAHTRWLGSGECAKNEQSNGAGGHCATSREATPVVFRGVNQVMESSPHSRGGELHAAVGVQSCDRDGVLGAVFGDSQFLSSIESERHTLQILRNFYSKSEGF